MAEAAQEPMERERRTLREVSPERNLALAIGLAVLAACQPIEARPTDETPVPTPTPEFTPTPEGEPTPTVVKRGIETIQREIGGVQGTDFLVAYKDEIQEGIQFDLENGQRWFILGVYPDLPGWEETTHFEEEYVLYENDKEDRMVFLTARGANKKYDDALPFYWKEETVSGPNGNFFYIKEGRMVAVAEPFVNLEENEAKIVFNREAGRYEFLDKDGKVTREIRVFEVVKPAPGLEGLTYNAQEHKYYAEAGNPYGLEVGEYAGMYYSNVLVQEKEEQGELTGGVALRAEVVRRLIDEAAAKIEDPKQRFVIPIPVDISSLPDESQQIVIAEGVFTSPSRGNSWSVIPIEAPPGLPIINILGYQEQVVDLGVLPNFRTDTLFYDAFRLVEPYTDSIYRGLEMRYISIHTSMNPPSEPLTLENLEFGDRLIIDEEGVVTQKRTLGSSSYFSPSGNWNILLMIGAGIERRDMRFPENILTISNPEGRISPVFIIGNG